MPQVPDAQTSRPLNKRYTMIPINDTIAIAENDIEERFIRAKGPGGQNARNEETAVQLRYDVSRSSLPPEVKLRLLVLLRRAALTPALRHATHPSRMDRETRLAAKRLRAAAKELRSKPPED
jgi:ribosome-associated protein